MPHRRGVSAADVAHRLILQALSEAADRLAQRGVDTRKLLAVEVVYSPGLDVPLRVVAPGECRARGRIEHDPIRLAALVQGDREPARLVACWIETDVCRDPERWR